MGVDGVVEEERVHMGMSWSEPIRRALDIVPIVPDCEWFLGDPVFKGLHDHTDTGDGRSLRDTTHVVYPESLHRLTADRRRTTVVIPERPRDDQYDIDGLVHELGHVADWMTGFDRTCTPIGEYAEGHRNEAFAEAFTAWLIPDYPQRWTDAYRAWPREDMALSELDPDDRLWFEANLR